jgi:NAD(P)-dependent dehydrogenase (short-subunit alcohol dehydrogenase family)
LHHFALMRALVTGAACLVGSYLCERLLARGDEVVAIDDLSTGSYGRMHHLKRDSHFVFIEHDVTEAFAASVDCIFHLAVPSAQKAKDPAAVALTCVGGTKHVLEVASQRAIPVVLLTSLDPGEPSCARWAEELALAVGHRESLLVSVVRAAPAFGPRMDPDFAHPASKLLLMALGHHVKASLTELERLDDPPMIRLAWAGTVAQTLATCVTPGVVIAPFFETTHDALDDIVRAACARGAGLSASSADEGYGDSDTPDDLETTILRTASWFGRMAPPKRRTPRSSGVYIRDDRREGAAPKHQAAADSQR